MGINLRTLGNTVLLATAFYFTSCASLPDITYDRPGKSCQFIKRFEHFGTDESSAIASMLKEVQLVGGNTMFYGKNAEDYLHASEAENVYSDGKNMVFELLVIVKTAPPEGESKFTGIAFLCK
jgi:hypothetical protein